MASSTDPPLVSSALLAGERVTFTGTLASMTHRQASALVEERGGLATEHVSRQTTLLVIGEEGWPLEPDGMPSLKLQQALRWQLAGQSLRILRESEWLSVLGLTEAREEMTRLYTPAMLSQMLGLSVATIRRWAHLGLIRAARVVYRLPYFSFAEVAGVRRLSELVDAGVGIAEIGKSLEALRALFPDIDRPLAQLELLGRHHAVVIRDPHGRLVTPTGQRLFDFEAAEGPAETSSANGLSDDDAPSTVPFPGTSTEPTASRDARPQSAEEWHRLAERQAETGDLVQAIASQREAVRREPLRSVEQAYLAELLYRAGQAAAAAERLAMAVELDPEDLEVWTQLGCIQVELGQVEEAETAFREALERHPDYPDAHFHLGELLSGRGDDEAAAAHWHAYLRHDQRGPWAEVARARLSKGPPSS